MLWLRLFFSPQSPPLPIATDKLIFSRAKEKPLTRILHGPSVSLSLNRSLSLCFALSLCLSLSLSLCLSLSLSLSLSLHLHIFLLLFFQTHTRVMSLPALLRVWRNTFSRVVLWSVSNIFILSTETQNTALIWNLSALSRQRRHTAEHLMYLSDVRKQLPLVFQLHSEWCLAIV